MRLKTYLLFDKKSNEVVFSDFVNRIDICEHISLLNQDRKHSSLVLKPDEFNIISLPFPIWCKECGLQYHKVYGEK